MEFMVLLQIKLTKEQSKRRNQYGTYFILFKTTNLLRIFTDVDTYSDYDLNDTLQENFTDILVGEERSICKCL
jgi:hypothetical protein